MIPLTAGARISHGNMHYNTTTIHRLIPFKTNPQYIKYSLVVQLSASHITILYV